MQQIDSPNYGARRGACPVDLVVLHYTAMNTAQAAIHRLCDPKAEVSAHYVIDEHGAVTRLVAEQFRAWHAGAGRWGNLTDVNSASIGIELANPGDAPFPDPQMLALEALLGDILQRHVIEPVRVIGHSDMAPERKVDPGVRFDWHRLALNGLSVWPHPRHDDLAVPNMRQFTVHAAQFGYPPAAPKAVLSAFRRRFRPYATGALDTVDMAMIADLAKRFPVDRTAPSP